MIRGRLPVLKVRDLLVVTGAATTCGALPSLLRPAPRLEGCLYVAMTVKNIVRVQA